MAICQTHDGASVVLVRRGEDGQPSLEHADWISFAPPQEKSLGPLTNQIELPSACCIAVLPPDSYQLLQIEMADMPVDERRDAARWQIRELLDYPVAEAVIDVFNVPPFGSDKKTLTYVVAARESLLRERVALLRAAELDTLAIDIPEFALRNLTELFTEDLRGTAILLLQEQGGLLTIARDGIHYLTRSLTIGMSDLLPFVDGDYEALTEQLDSIVLEIQRSFDYCESTFNLPMVSRLLVAQTGREISAVKTYLTDYLSTQVELFSFDGVMSVPEDLEQLQLNQHLLAIGGALRQEKN